MSFPSICPRGLRRLVAAAVLTVGALAAPLGLTAAHAAVGDLTCTAVYKINFSPALTASTTSSQATALVGLSKCLSLNGRYTYLKSATMTGAGRATSLGVIPCNLVLTIQMAFHILWSNGQSSNLSATINSNPLAGTLGFNGVVTSGTLAGDTVTAIGPYVPNVDCLFNGLTSITGTNQKVFS